MTKSATLKTSCDRRIFLAGVSSVGKTPVGSRLARLLYCRFFDLDFEIERFFGSSIERIQNRYLTSHSFRVAASQVLQHVLSGEDARSCVIALPPSGLMGPYWTVVSKAQDPRLLCSRIPRRIS
jgi:shikimate kinase